MNVALISTSTYPSDQGIRHVSSMLKKHGHKVKIFFLPEAENYSKKYSKKVLSQLFEMCKDFDIIGISSYASTSVRAIQVVNHLKPLNKPIIWGGIHATISPDKCIEHVDLVCVGEGELTMLELLEKLEKKQDITKIQNLWVRKDGKIYKNEIRKLIEDLDSLPPPDYDIEDHYILERNKIVQFEERHLNGMIFFQTERGCPNACAYCSNIILRKLHTGKGKLIRFNSIGYAVREMARLKNKFKTLGVFDIRDETLF
ncbi:MAG: cobalamin-dependent protein, partial [Candidatus Nanoarchaeia archaeon]